jgi:membrane-associated PAP2 superfamily phosphatase
MTRTGLVIALAIAAVTGLLFGLYPELDLRLARVFYEYVDASGNTFAWRLSPPLARARDAGLWVGTVLIAPSLIALAIKLIWPRRKLLVSGRAILFLTATLALGPGLLVNVLLKDHWGRPRPIDVAQFGGAEHFVAWWDPRGDCDKNCAFVSGDVSGAFWTVAPAVLAPPPLRAICVGAALALGTGMAAVRMMAGAHFASDVIFAGVFTFFIIWIVYALIYRWPRTRLSDAGVERDIEAVANTRYRLKKLFGGKDRNMDRKKDRTAG